MRLNVSNYCSILSKKQLSGEYVQKATGLSEKTYLWILEHGLNQIGIKIDMYGQEYRFSPAFACIQAVCRLVRCIYSCSIARISSSVGISTIPT